MKDGFLRRRANMPTVTSDDERRTALAEARLRARAGGDALVEFFKGTIKQTQERLPEWLADLDERTAAAEAEREEALRLLAAADTEIREAERLRRWLTRTAATEGPPTAIDHIPFTQVGVPLPTPEPDWDNIRGVVTSA